MGCAGKGKARNWRLRRCRAVLSSVAQDFDGKHSEHVPYLKPPESANRLVEYRNTEGCAMLTLDTWAPKRAALQVLAECPLGQFLFMSAVFPTVNSYNRI